MRYGKPSYILVAGYVNRGEAEEHAVVREVREETGLEVEHLRFNRTKFFEPSNTLMCNFTAFVRTAKALHINHEVDRCKWVHPTGSQRKHPSQQPCSGIFECVSGRSGE